MNETLKCNIEIVFDDAYTELRYIARFFTNSSFYDRIQTKNVYRPFDAINKETKRIDNRQKIKRKKWTNEEKY